MPKALSNLIEHNETSIDEKRSNLSGLLLISMPGLSDTEFENAVILLCKHDNEHAFGLVLNHQILDLSLKEILVSIEFDQNIVEDQFEPFSNQPVFSGGPIDKGRGFVLHSLDYQVENSTTVISPHLTDSEGISLECGLTASRDILVDLVKGIGPVKSKLSLGYTGWGPGQLEKELTNNYWLLAPASHDIIFESDLSAIRQKALYQLGIDPHHLSSLTGSA